MLDRSLSEASGFWDPLVLEDAADNGMPTHSSFEMGAELEDPGWTPLEDDKMFWGEEQPQSVASVLDASHPAKGTHSRERSLLDSSFMSCGSSSDTMGRFVLMSPTDEATQSPPTGSQAPPSAAATESLMREILVINGLPLEARATAIGLWMAKVKSVGGAFYNECVQRAVGVLSTTHPSPLSSCDRVGSGCLEQPSCSDSARSGWKRSRCDDPDPSTSSWRSFGGSASKRSRTHAAALNNEYESEGGHFSLGASQSGRSSFMITTPSTQTSHNVYNSSQQFTLADMDQQLVGLMSGEPLWADGSANFPAEPYFAGAACEPFSVANYGVQSNTNNLAIDTGAWDSSKLVDEVAPGEDLPPVFFEKLNEMVNESHLIDL